MSCEFIIGINLFLYAFRFFSLGDFSDGDHHIAHRYSCTCVSFISGCTHAVIQIYFVIPLIQLFETDCLDRKELQPYQTASQVLHRNVTLRK